MDWCALCKFAATACPARGGIREYRRGLGLLVASQAKQGGQKGHTVLNASLRVRAVVRQAQAVARRPKRWIGRPL